MKHKPKQKFSEDEDRKITELVRMNGERGWRRIAENIPGRTARQCRERWKNYLSPKVSLDPWTNEEDELLKRLITEMGQQWSKMASFFPKRTDVTIKNRWALLKRRNNRRNHESVIPAQKPLKEFQFEAQIENTTYDDSIFFIENYPSNYEGFDSWGL